MCMKCSNGPATYTGDIYLGGGGGGGALTFPLRVTKELILESCSVVRHGWPGQEMFSPSAVGLI